MHFILLLKGFQLCINREESQTLLLARAVSKINSGSSSLVFNRLKERMAFSIMSPPLYRNEFMSTMNLRFNNSNFLNYQRVHENAATLRHR